MRIIGGAFGGRRLLAPRGLRTRPTADRVREALFSMLGPLEGARVLDLYAGTGALGLEALSRGARSVTFVESRREAIMALRENAARLGPDLPVRLVEARVERAASRLDDWSYDLVLADPPWRELDRAIGALRELLAGRMAPRARLVFEHPARMPASAFSGLPWPPSDRRTWGDTGVTLCELPDQGADATSGAPTP